MVVKREGKYISDIPEWVKEEDIIKTESERVGGKNKIIITTVNGEYVYNTSVDHFLTLMSEKHGFEVVDRGRMANLNHEFVLDEDKGLVVFENHQKISTTATPIGLKKIKEYIKKYLKKQQ